MAGTTWFNFSPATLIKSSEVNFNFDWLEGSILPMTSGSTTTAVFDLGSPSAVWRNLYLSSSIVLGSTTMTSADIGKVDTTSLEVSGGTMRVKDAGISTTKLATNAVTQIVSTNNVTSPSIGLFSTTLQTLSITTEGGVVIAMAKVNVSAPNPSTIAAMGLDLVFVRDSTLLHSSYANSLVLTGTSQCLSAFCLDTPSAGGHTYYLMGNFNNMPPSSVSSFLVFEVKR